MMRCFNVLDLQLPLMISGPSSTVSLEAHEENYKYDISTQYGVNENVRENLMSTCAPIIKCNTFSIIPENFSIHLD